MLSEVFQILFFTVMTNGQLTNDVDRLMTDLFNSSGYNKVIRPVINTSTIIQVETTLEVLSISYVDVTSSTIQVNGVFSVSWRDEFLAWNTNDYMGIDSLSLPPGFIWTPEIALFKGSINDVRILDKSDFCPIWVESNGHVQMYPAGDIISTCTVDISWFPFDSHVCNFKLISARYDTKQLLLKSSQTGIDLGEFHENSEWVVTSPKLGECNELSGGTMTVSYISKQIKVVRRPAFALIHIFVPEMLISFLNIATCFVPFDSGERLSFAITIFMSFIFLCGTIIAELPRNSIGFSFTSFTLLMTNLTNACVVVCSIVVVRVSKWSSEEVKMPCLVHRLLSKTGYSKSVEACKPKDTGDESKTEVECSPIQEEANTFEPITNTHPVSWYQFALLLDKCVFIFVVIINSASFIVQMTLFKLNQIV